MSWEWNDSSVQLIDRWVDLAAIVLLGFGFFLARSGLNARYQLRRDRGLIALGVLGGLAYFNYGQLHFGKFIHVWDTYHYYVGAKYFPELNYDRLYQCATLADAEDGHRAQAEKRTITDLRTNVMVRSTDILAHPEECKSHFTDARWRQFEADVNFFRSRVNDQRWTQIHQDHGYNATPVWTLLGFALTNLGPASTTQVTLLSLLDPLYLLAMAALLYWAFGPRVFGLGLLILGTNFPNRFYWTGGAFLRHDWLFYLVAVVCLLKKGRPTLAGAALAYATLLRVFPGLLLVGPLLAGVVELERWWRRRSVTGVREPSTGAFSAALKRFLLGGVVATLILVSASVAAFGGATWQRFAANTQKHASTPLTNHMGLRTVLSYRPSTIGALTHGRDGVELDPWARWKQARLDNFERLQPLFYALVGGFIVLMFVAIRHQGGELWLAAALGVGLIPFAAELTCYYYGFLIGFAALHAKHREVGLWLLALCLFTQMTAWAPLKWMSRWPDEQYTVMSVATLVAVVAGAWCFTPAGERVCVEPEPQPAPFKTLL